MKRYKYLGWLSDNNYVVREHLEGTLIELEEGEAVIKIDAFIWGMNHYLNLSDNQVIEAFFRKLKDQTLLSKSNIEKELPEVKE